MFMLDEATGMCKKKIQSACAPDPKMFPSDLFWVTNCTFIKFLKIIAR